MNIRKTNGITLITLVITIILLLIIAGISIDGTIRGKEETKEAKEKTELAMVQHAILERKTKSQLTKTSLPGIDLTQEQINTIINEINNLAKESINIKGKNFKKLDKSDLENLGLSNTEDIYVVEYDTGEVINYTKKVTKTGEALYLYSLSK